MADREEFLTTIREATARGRAHRVAVNPEATASAAYVGGGDDPPGKLLAEWIAVGGKGERVHSAAEVNDFLARLIARYQIKRAIRWQHPLLERLKIDLELSKLGVTLVSWDELAQQSSESRWQTAFAADLGITSVDWAVAETGTLALCSQRNQGRVVSLLPPVYLAIVEPSQIVPDLFDLFERLESHKQKLPSNISLVTGPSKTGDIELKLTTGVHGPGEVWLLVIDEID